MGEFLEGAEKRKMSARQILPSICTNDTLLTVPDAGEEPGYK